MTVLVTFDEAVSRAGYIRALCQDQLVKNKGEGAQLSVFGPTYFPGVAQELAPVPGWIVVVIIKGAERDISVTVPVTGMLPIAARFRRAVTFGLQLARRLP